MTLFILFYEVDAFLFFHKYIIICNDEINILFKHGFFLGYLADHCILHNLYIPCNLKFCLLNEWKNILHYRFLTAQLQCGLGFATNPNRYPLFN
jgi:hypothetical protein